MLKFLFCHRWNLIDFTGYGVVLGLVIQHGIIGLLAIIPFSIVSGFGVAMLNDIEDGQT